MQTLLAMALINYLIGHITKSGQKISPFFGHYLYFSCRYYNALSLPYYCQLYVMYEHVLSTLLESMLFKLVPIHLLEWQFSSVVAPTLKCSVSQQERKDSIDTSKATTHQPQPVKSVQQLFSYMNVLFNAYLFPEGIKVENSALAQHSTLSQESGNHY